MLRLSLGKSIENKAGPGENFRWYFFVLLVSAGFLLTCCSEKSPLLEGYGSDGAYYGHYTLHMDSVLENHQLPTRLYERILPIYLTHLIFKSMAIEPTTERMIHLDRDWHFNQGVVWAYMWYNFILFLLGAYIWLLITKALRLGIAGTFCSIILLFVNFCNSKQYFYEPVMIDQSTMLCGVIAAYGVVRKNRFLLLLTGLAGLVVNAAIPIYMLMILLLPFTTQDQLQNNRIKPRIAHFAAISMALFVGVVAAYYFFNPLCHPEAGELPTRKELFPLSLIFIMVFTWLGAKQVFEVVPRYNFKELFKRLHWREFLLLAGATITWRIYSSHNGLEGAIADGLCDDVQNGMWNYFVYILRYSYTRPAGLVAADFAYFGIAFIGVILGWKIICKQAIFYGPGLLILLLIAVVHGLNTESRQMVFVFPLLLMLLSAGLSNYKFRNLEVGFLALLGLVSSKVWYPINPLNSADYPVSFQSLLYSPLQKYFMNLGPWMNDRNYIIHLSCALLLLTGGYLYMHRSNLAIRLKDGIE